MISTYQLCFVLPFLVFCNNILKVVCSPQLLLKNDGPAVLGANVTFFSSLMHYSVYSKLIYTFDDGVQDPVSFTSKNLDISLSLVFPIELYVEQQYCMNVTVEVERLVVSKKKIAENYTCFELKRFLIGEIVVHQGNNIRNDDDSKNVAIGENFTTVVELYDPNHYLENAAIDYSWSFDMDNYVTFNNSFIYNYTEAGDKLIIAKVTATLPDSLSISGYFTKTLSAKVPVNHVNISGNPFLHHGDFLLLNVSCDGTPNFAYCSEILKENTTFDNFTCTRISKFTTCHMEIKTFLKDGKYQMGIYVANDVSEVKKKIEVMVYNVSIKPALSTIIIPIVCSLLTLIIIAIGISYYIQQKNQLAVEVADFDFRDESDSYTGEQRTFFEKILDSFACRNCRDNRWSCVNNRRESDPLLSDDSLPYV